MARITRFPAGEGTLPVLPPSAYDPLPGLEEALRTLDDLLRLLYMARQSGENLTNSPVFGRELEQAANELSEVCDDLKGAGHE